MRVSPHLVFNGQCEAAFRFYEATLGGRIVTILTYGDSPMAEQLPAAWRGKIVHASLTIGDTILSGVDAEPGQEIHAQGFYVLLSVDTLAEAERIFHTLAEGGTVQLAFQQTFWSSGFGVVTDRFGTPWEISCEQAPGAA